MSEEHDPLTPKSLKYDPIERKMPRGLVIRLVAYLVAGHVIAGFIYLLFTVGMHNQ
ncbi:DUF6126 family protein [Streptomyces sp. DT24]|uniref:DUF6126 family protein n=1 Tax=unclassified Streptomyces TaxID=2593676 RepID=UPI0023B8E458|nr:DUF6126 family protein [Streptomyces sp. AM 4-1-1]WEH36848.1 DUF6126 family protein [Streptomyces sp. AM 4-1-1]